ncbi:aquaporin-1 [Acrodontium crateriforme]|uniref:Aquaporin-1 n=1 Tax=Acrodontium crateriforme TaxID=150365 RepID=A0AAQ3M7P3_9PEZI|nr:aquaporin-1 [Acrodontium crateriforme]
MNIDRASRRLINLPFMPREVLNDTTDKNELHFPLIGYLPNKIRNHFVAMSGEFAGTFLFLFFSFSATQVANAAAAGAETNNGSLTQIPNTGTLMFISLAFGFSLAVNAWVFFRISGGLFNPAVTLGMGLIGAISWPRALLVFIAQIFGSLAASGVVSALFPGPLSVSTALGGGTSVVQGLFIEMFLTAELVFAIFMLAAEKHKGTFLAPVGIGLALFVAEMSGVYFTGGSLNPARSFAPCVILRNFPSYHWIYWLGPCLGSIIAVGFFRFVKTLEYETANPGQDFNEKEAEHFDFDEENAATAADVARPDISTILSQQSGLPLSNLSGGILSPVLSQTAPLRTATMSSQQKADDSHYAPTASSGDDGPFRDAAKAENGLAGSSREL